MLNNKTEPIRKLVLIDNDPLIYTSWKLMAKKNNHTLYYFKDVESFLHCSSDYSKEIEIYIDDDLQLEQPGHLLAKTIFDLGFKNIHLASGSKLETLPPWILDQTGKNYPLA